MIGVTGENEATALVIDVSSVLDVQPEATFGIEVLRPDHTRYPAAVGLEADCNGCIEYLVNGVDLVKPGHIVYQVHAHAGTTHIKSWTAQFEVLPGLSGLNRPALKPDWVCKLMDSIHDVYRARDEAAGYRDQAETIAADMAAMLEQSQAAMDAIQAAHDEIMDALEGLQADGGLNNIIELESKQDLPEVGADRVLYLIDGAAYVWLDDPAGYVPLMWDAEEPLEGVVIDCGEVV
ncbi:hypothetical protein AGMMS49992_25790 [Clostridia bacterium]|nr:hypothetical protein AGMMS49992_25790 [Clostridia bacterium]